MPDRVHADNCLWVLCCCGCLPIIGTIKGAIAVAVLIFPLHIMNAFYSVLVTRRLGCNLKILSLILLPVPLALYIPVVVLGSVFVGLGIGFGGPFMYTFDGNYNLLCGGFGKVLKFTGNCIVDFWNWNVHQAWDEFRSLRSYRGDPFDIPLYQLVISLVIAACGLVIDLPVFTVIAAIKLVPGIIYWMGWLIVSYVEAVLGRDCVLALMGFPLFCVALALAPVGAVFCFAGAVLWGAAAGLISAYVAYEEGLGRSFRQMWQNCIDMDEFSGEIVFLKSYKWRLLSRDNCCPCREREPAYHHDPAFHPDPEPVEIHVEAKAPAEQQGGPPLARQRSFFGEIPISQIWDSFFRMCELNMKQAMTDKQITRDDVEGFEPYVLLGVPSVTVFRALVRSIETKTDGIMMADGVVVNDENRPNNPVANMFWGPLKTAQRDMKRANLQEAELKYMEFAVFLKDKPGAVEPPSGGMTPERKAQLSRLAGQIKGMAITVSRLPQYRREFANIVGRVTEGMPAGGGGGPPGGLQPDSESPAVR